MDDTAASVSQEISQKRQNGSRKGRRTIVSLLGATLVFGTFLAKDARRDRLKDFVESLESTENAYLNRKGNRETYMALKNFKNEFDDFRQHPSKPVKRFGGGYSRFDITPGTIDYEGLNDLRLDALLMDDLFDDLLRLNRKLPNFRAQMASFREIDTLSHKLWKQLSVVDNEVWAIERKPNQTDKAAISKINDDITELGKITVERDIKLSDFARHILAIAEEERDLGEIRYQIWINATYVLYVVGFVMTIIGILIGGETEPMIEKVKEESWSR